MRWYVRLGSLGATDEALRAETREAQECMALVKNPLFARYIDRFAARNEDRGNADLRRELLDGLSGQLIEVGA